MSKYDEYTYEKTWEGQPYGPYYIKCGLMTTFLCSGLLRAQQAVSIFNSFDAETRTLLAYHLENVMTADPDEGEKFVASILNQPERLWFRYIWEELEKMDVDRTMRWDY